MPGGLDMGGDADGPPELGGDELSASGDEADSEALPEEKNMGLGMEGFDYAAEKRLLFEMRQQGQRQAAQALVNTWAQRLGKLPQTDPIEHLSGYTHFLESKELDGLSRSIPTVNTATESEGIQIYDPNKDDQLLVEWSVDEETRKTAIKEVYDVLTENQDGQPSIQEEITTDDLPIQQTN